MSSSLVSLTETPQMQLARVLTGKFETMEKRSLEMNNMINQLKLKNDEKELLLKYKEMSTKEEEKLFRSLLDDFEAIPILLRKIVLIENLYNFTFKNLKNKHEKSNKLEIIREKSLIKKYENKNEFEKVNKDDNKDNNDDNDDKNNNKLTSFMELLSKMEENYSKFEEFIKMITLEMKLSSEEEHQHPKPNKKKRSKIIL